LQPERDGRVRFSAWVGSKIFINSPLLASDEKTDDTQQHSANYHEDPLRFDHQRARRSIRANETQNIGDDVPKADRKQNETNHNQNNLEGLWFHKTRDAAY
jgi:hypothetical protein